MKRWSHIRQKLEEDYLCTRLRGRVQYFATTYKKCHDREGRAAIRLDGVEICKSGYYNYLHAHTQAYRQLTEGTRREKWEKAEEIAMDQGEFDQRDFYLDFQEFENQSIEQSLQSPRPLVRIFALLDRRTGKRRLLSLAETMERELPWVRVFYDVRMEAEGLERRNEHADS